MTSVFLTNENHENCNEASLDFSKWQFLLNIFLHINIIPSTVTITIN